MNFFCVPFQKDGYIVIMYKLLLDIHLEEMRIEYR